MAAVICIALIVLGLGLVQPESASLTVRYPDKKNIFYSKILGAILSVQSERSMRLFRGIRDRNMGRSG